MWSIWDKQSEINGSSAEHVFKTFNHLANEETVYIKTVDGRVTNVEGKGVLASVYGIDPTLPDDEFIAEYERVTAEPAEPEGDESATYDELAQVYREGVNSIDE
jgi:hypothetical protein